MISHIKKLNGVILEQSNAQKQNLKSLVKGREIWFIQSKYFFKSTKCSQQDDFVQLRNNLCLY